MVILGVGGARLMGWSYRAAPAGQGDQQQGSETNLEDGAKPGTIPSVLMEGAAVASGRVTSAGASLPEACGSSPKLALPMASVIRSQPMARAVRTCTRSHMHTTPDVSMARPGLWQSGLLPTDARPHALQPRVPA